MIVGKTKNSHRILTKVSTRIGEEKMIGFIQINIVCDSLIRAEMVINTAIRSNEAAKKNSFSYSFFFF